MTLSVTLEFSEQELDYFRSLMRRIRERNGHRSPGQVAAVARFATLLAEALSEVPARVPTKVPPQVNERRLDEKRRRGRTKQGRAYHYEPVRPKSQVISHMVDDFVGKVFAGSARPLVLSLVKDRKLSKKDLEEIARLIRETE